VLDEYSVTWRYIGDFRFLTALGGAFIMQAMHPTIRAGVVDHSIVMSDPFGRLLRSYGLVLKTIYGPDGPGVGAEVREFHKRITGVDESGRRYHAHEPEAYFWVAATGMDAIGRLAGRVMPPLSAADNARLYDELKEIGRRFGLRDRDMPGTRDDFDEWFRMILDERLENHPYTHGLLHLIRHAPAPPYVPRLAWQPLRPLAGQVLWVLTVGMLPRRAREVLGVRWTAADHVQLVAIERGLRALEPLPGRIRLLPPAKDAYRRALAAADSESQLEPALAG
jgi:uncharacterized protein (DUF2236 family)